VQAAEARQIIRERFPAYIEQRKQALHLTPWMTHERPPTLERFHQSQAFYRGVRGPVRGGKSTTMCWELMDIAQKQAPWNGTRSTRFVVVRNTYRELLDTTIKTWQDWFRPDKFGELNMNTMTHKIRLVLPDQTRMQTEVLFRALDRPDDVKKLLSLECTVAWVNEAREMPKGVIDVLGDRVGQYPALKDGGCTRRGVILDTNSPDDDHWWYHLAEEARPDNWEFFTQPGGLIEVDGQFINNPLAENIVNLEPNYYLTRMGGKDADYIRVYYCNQYGFIKEGKPVYPEYIDAVHCAETVLSPVPGVPVHVGLDFGLCYSKDTEVLTREGWKFFKDVDDKKDTVITLNPETFNIEYTPINFKVEYDYDGELISFDSQNFNFMVTPEHITPFTKRDTPHKIQFISAGDLMDHSKSHRYIQLYGNWTKGKDIRLFDIPDDMISSFMGWYISEGSTEVRGNSFRVTIAQQKDNEELDSLMKDSRWPHSYKWVKNKYGWRCTVSIDFGNYLKRLGKAKDKYVPDEIRYAKRDSIKLFLESYIAGDGHVRTKAKKNNGIGRKCRNEIVCATLSDKLKDNLQELALKIGYTSSARIQKGRTSYMPDGRAITSSDLWVVSFKRIDRAEILPHHVSRENYQGKIYCLNVPYHTLYIRRNGKTCWNGNTPAASFAQRLPIGRWIVFDELVTEDMGAVSFAKILKTKLLGEYGGYEFEVWGDPSGDNRAQTDEVTPFQIMRANGVPARPAPSNDPVLRREAVVASMKGLAMDGKPAFLLSPKCRVLRKAMAGGYYYRRVQVTGEARFQDKAEKNKYSHVAESLQYLFLGAGEGRGLVQEPKSRTRMPTAVTDWNVYD